MTSKRKLEEKIAESKDPVIRKQLQELLDLRNKRSRQRIDKAKKVVNYIDKFGAVDVNKMTPEEKKKYDRDCKTVLIFFGVLFGLLFVFAIYVIISTW